MNARPLLALTAPAPTGRESRRRTRAPRPQRRGRFRPRGSEIRGLIAELRELTRGAARLRLEGADDAALSAKRIEIERRQSELADAVRRDPTFGRAAPGAAPLLEPVGVEARAHVDVELT
jgi:hypothetical protein